MNGSAQTGVIYDARNGKSSLFGGIMLPFAIVLIVLLVRVIRNPKRARADDSLGTRAAASLMLVSIVGALIASSLPFFLSLSAKRALAAGTVNVVQGCVRNFERQVHVNQHNVTDTYSSVGGRAFHFNSSPWLPGFHNELDEVSAGERLRMTTSGDRVLLIERVPAACAARAG